MYCFFTGASIGVYGTTTYIIVFNKCFGILEIIGLSSTFEFCILFFKLLKNKDIIYINIFRGYEMNYFYEE